MQMPPPPPKDMLDTQTAPKKGFFLEGLFLTDFETYAAPRPLFCSNFGCWYFTPIAIIHQNFG